MKKIYLTVQEFADLHHINKRTLHYYDSIGIFSPRKIGENHYRYYTYAQSAEFEIILALRELGMGINEIKKYLETRSEETFEEVLLEKSREIQEKIEHLEDTQALLKEKQADLHLSRSDQIGKIDLVELEPEYLLLADISHLKSIEDVDESIYDSLSCYESNGKPVRAFNSGYGSMICTEHLLSGIFTEYTYLFVKIRKPPKDTDLFLKPGGTYLRAFCKGRWDHIPDTYRRMLQYAEKHHLVLSGYSYEEGINELTIPSEKDMDQYVTRILIPCRKSE